MKRLIFLSGLIFCLFIASSAFADVLKLPAGIKSIEAEAFSGVTGLDQVVIPEGAQSIGSRAFADSSLRLIGLPLSMTHIAEDAFENVKNLVVRALFGSYAYDWAKEHGYFVNESPLSDFTFRVIDDETCGIAKYTGSDEKIMIPSADAEGRQVVKIESSAFYQNQVITGVCIPEGVTEIGASAFDGCSALSSVVFPAALKTVGSNAFRNCNTASDTRAYFDLPDTVANVYNNGSFSGNIIPVCGKYSDTALALSHANIDFSCPGEEDFLYRYISAGELTLVNYIGASETVAIPEGISRIYRAFYKNKAITSVTIPEGTVSIDNASFYSCSSLSNVVFPSTIETIGQYAFYGCNTASEICAYYYLPDNIASVYGYDSFYNNEPASAHKIIPVCARGSSTAQALSKANIEFIYMLSAPVTVPEPPALAAEETKQEEQEKIEEAEEQQERPLTDEELTEIFKSIGRSGLVSLLEGSDTKNNDRVSKYYVEHLSEFSEIINVLEKILNGKYTDILFSGEKKTKYLFAQALKMMDETDDFRFIKINLKDSELYDIAHDGPEAALNIYFEHLADLGFSATAREFLASNKDFEELFKKYAKGEIGPDGIEAALSSMIKPEELGKNAGDIMKSLEQYKGISKVLKAVGVITEVAGLADRVMEIANQVNILQSLDSASLQPVADIYLSSDDDDVRAVGYKLQALSSVTNEELLIMVAGDQFIDYGLDKAIKAMVKSADTSFIALDISNFIVNEFTSVDQVTGLVDKVKWANEAANVAYESYRAARDQYELTQSDDDLRELYRTMKIYYGAAAQSEEALLDIYKEIDNSMLGDLWLRQDYRTMMEQLQDMADYYRKTADYATLDYEYCQNGDPSYFRSGLDKINEKYVKQ